MAAQPVDHIIESQQVEEHDPKKVESQQIEDIDPEDGEKIGVHTDTFDIALEAIGSHMPRHYYMNWRLIAITIGCMLGTNANFLSYVLVANATRPIIAELGFSNSFQWIFSVYTIAVSTSLLITGRLSDIFGRRWFIIGGNFCNCLGAIIAAVAQDIPTVIVGMMFIGLGGAVQLSFPAIIGELVPKNHRPLWVGLIYFACLGPYGFGPSVAQSLLASTDNEWRWCFYLNIIISGLGVLLFFFCYHPPNFHMLHVRRSKMEQLKRTDIVGILLFAAGMVLFITGLNWGGTAYPWASAHVLAPLLTGVFSFVIFILWEMNYKGDQILPLRLFTYPGFIPMTICSSIGSCVAISLAVIWPQEVLNLMTGTPVQLGLLTSVQGSTTLAGFAAGGPIIYFFPRHRAVIATCCLLLTAFSGALASVQPGDSVKASVFVSLGGFAIGIIETASRALIPLSCPDEDIGTALGAMSSIAYALASIATAVYSTILDNKVKSIAPPAISEAALQAGLPASSVTSLLINYSLNITAVPGMNTNIATAVQGAVSQSYADSFRYVWYAAVGFGMCSVIASIFIIDYTKYNTDEVARRLRDAPKRTASDPSDKIVV